MLALHWHQCNRVQVYALWVMRSTVCLASNSHFLVFPGSAVLYFITLHWFAKKRTITWCKKELRGVNCSEVNSERWQTGCAQWSAPICLRPMPVRGAPTAGRNANVPS
ncbi:hypothetical protein JOM56_000741 [Amanita muscaria]